MSFLFYLGLEKEEILSYSQSGERSKFLNSVNNGIKLTRLLYRRSGCWLGKLYPWSSSLRFDQVDVLGSRLFCDMHNWESSILICCLIFVSYSFQIKPNHISYSIYLALHNTEKSKCSLPPLNKETFCNCLNVDIWTEITFLHDVWLCVHW